LAKLPIEKHQRCIGNVAMGVEGTSTVSALLGQSLFPDTAFALVIGI